MKKLLKLLIKQNKFKILILYVFIVINVYLITIPPKIIGNIIDMLYNIEQNRVGIFNSVFLLLGVSVLLLVVRLVWKYMDTLVPRSFEKIVKDNLFEHFLKMKISDIQNIKNGELMSHFTKDINQLRRTVARFCNSLPRIIFTTIFVISAMKENINLQLTLICALPLVICAISIVYIKKYINIAYEKNQKEFTKMSEFLQEGTDSIRTVKAYQLEDKQIERYVHINEKVKDTGVKADFYSTLLSVITHTCFGITYGLAIIFGGKYVLEGTITVGMFVAFNSYIGLLKNPVSWLPLFITTYKRGAVSYKRLDKLFSIVEEKSETFNENNEHSILGDINIKNLNFAYEGCMDKVLDNINLEIKKGETIGIIGKVGSGKTTLMNLLVKLYKVPEGKISINGMDINDIPIEVLRNNVCYITQDNFLFSTTIKENISLFKDIYEDEEIKESIEDAMVYDEIMSLPNGIDTIIGERGVDLSGGQKQRVVISRAFLNKSDIVIFDDTFSALDNKTEQHLLKNIKKLTDGKTCFIISNRISDIRHADKIIVIDEGKIIETGTHKKLMNSKSYYYEFYKQQAIKKRIQFLAKEVKNEKR